MRGERSPNDEADVHTKVQAPEHYYEATMTSIDDILAERMSGRSDYPDFWDPDEGDELEGIVTKRKDNPWAEDDDDDPTQMLYVQQMEGSELATRTHKILSDLVEDNDVQAGDYVRIEYVGKVDTDGPNAANDYRMAVVKEDELEDFDIPTSDGGVTTANHVAPDTTVHEQEVPQDSRQFLNSLMDFHGHLDIEELDRYLNEVRDFNVDAETVAEQCGYVVKNDVIRKPDDE